MLDNRLRALEDLQFAPPDLRFRIRGPGRAYPLILRAQVEAQLHPHLRGVRAMSEGVCARGWREVGGEERTVVSWRRQKTFCHAARPAGPMARIASQPRPALMWSVIGAVRERPRNGLHRLVRVKIDLTKS